jgi:gliding motility-associated-like protein
VSSYPVNNYFYIEDVLIQPFDPLPDTLLLCDGQAVTLNASFLDASYLWNTGTLDSLFTISTPGTYTVEAFMDNCVLRDTVVVLDTRDNAFQKDTSICSDEPITLAAPLPGSYLWSDGSTGRELQVASTGSYSVTVTNDCGQFSLSTQVEAMDCGCRVYVPNAISPNGDGINDELRAYFGCDYEYRTLRFAVFDRWGGQVYTSGEGEVPAWDGSARGRPLPPGTYAWFLEYETLRNGMAEKHLEKGDVNLIR